MSLEFHKEALDKLCRVCGKLNSIRGSSKQQAECCTAYSKELYVCGISVWEDDPLCCPYQVCWRCCRTLRHVKDKTREDNPAIDAIQEWQRHSRTGQCETCELYKKQIKGGRPAKRKRGDNLHNFGQNKQTIYSINSVRNSQVAFNITSTEESSLVSYKLCILGKDPQEETLFICVICQCIIGSPSVQTPCEHNFCSQCLFKWFCFKDSYEVPCPICRSNVNYHDVAVSPRILRYQLSTLNTACIDCGTIGKLTTMASHNCPKKFNKSAQCHCKLCEHPPSAPSPSENKHHSLTQQATEAAVILKQFASEHKKGTPIPSMIEEATDRWTWLKLQVGRGLETRLKTPGRVRLFKIQLIKTTNLFNNFCEIYVYM